MFVSVTDKVKRIVVDKGAVPSLLKLLRSGDSEERESAALAVWTISFSKENREKLKVAILMMFNTFSCLPLRC